MKPKKINLFEPIEYPKDSEIVIYDKIMMFAPKRKKK